MLHAVIMAGGAGTRFWPASRVARPKQLLNLVGEQSMIQATVGRLGDLVSAEQVLVVTNESLVEPIRAQLPDLPREAVLGEPCKRDTAPCIGLAAALVSRMDEEATMVVMPADHVIQPNDVFQQAIRSAAELVEQYPGRLVTFGIPPTYPASTFGYIQRGMPLDGGQSYHVQQFREKPSRETAEQYLASGEFYWNSGIFLWKARTILEALARFEPEMAELLTEIAAAMGTERFGQVLTDRFQRIRGKSIDYAVMEHYDDVVVMEAPFGWDDVGNWQSLARMRGTDADGNTIVGRHLGLNTTGTIVRSDDQHLVVTLGMKDCIVVHTPDATLVANKHDEESVRQIVKLIEENGWNEYL